MIIAFCCFSLWRCAAPNSPSKPVPNVEVAVLNATDIHRLGRAVEMDLLNRGFNVFRVGDTNVHFAHTTVVDLRDPDGKKAQAVADALARKGRLLWFSWGRRLVPKIMVNIDSGQYLDVQIIVGNDYKQFFPQAVPLY